MPAETGHRGNRSAWILTGVLALWLVSGPLSASGPVVVEIRDYKFVPESVTVKAGATIKWLNAERRTSHSVWFKEEGLPESDRFFPEESWTRKFDKPGTYRYTCGPHPEMFGVVVVE